MRTFNQFFTSSIRRRISSAFLIVTVFVVAMVAANYLQLRQVKPFSDLIIHDSSDLVYIQKLAAGTSALDADLERYLVIRGAEYQESVQQDLQKMTEMLKALQDTPRQEILPDLAALEETITRLQSEVQQVVGAQASGASSGQVNRAVVAVYKDIDSVKQQQDGLSVKTLAELTTAAETQGRLANSVLTQSVVVGLIVSVIALVTMFVTDRRLRAISILTDTTAAIAEGDLTRVAPVEGNDEISKLAISFNAMTTQLRDLIGSLEQRVTDRTKALTTSTEVSRRLSTILDRDKLVKEVVEQLVTAFGYYYAHIYLLDETKETLVMVGGTGQAGQTMLAHGHKILKGRGLVGRAAETNTVVLASDTSKEEGWLPNELLPETRSEIAVPISMGDEMLGVFDVQHSIVNGLTEQDADLLQSIANQVAVALQNIRRYENTQKIAADMGVVANVGIAISTITEIGHLLQEVVDLSKKSFNLYHAHIYLLNEAGDTLELAAGAGEVGQQMVSEKRSISLDKEQSLVARAARTYKGVVVNDVTVTPDFLPNPLLPETRSEMAVPMLVAGKVIGVLDVQSEIANRFTEVDVSIQTTLASQVAVALQNARSFSQTQQQAERETTLNLITQKIQNATSIEAALQIAARELGHALGMKPTLVALDPLTLKSQ